MFRQEVKGQGNVDVAQARALRFCRQFTALSRAPGPCVAASLDVCRGVNQKNSIVASVWVENARLRLPRVVRLRVPRANFYPKYCVRHGLNTNYSFTW